jgi:insulysin
MRVMLVSDYESKSAAASLQVGVGNLQDPPDFDGLAHFCEHMLFLGTEEFPEENHYSKFI